jgi:hypothetical protein
MLPVTRLRAGAIRIGALALVSALPMTFVVAWTCRSCSRAASSRPSNCRPCSPCVAAVQLLVVYAPTITAPPGNDVEAPGRPPLSPGIRRGGDPCCLSVHPAQPTAAGDRQRHNRARDGGSLSSRACGRRERPDPDADGRCGRVLDPRLGAQVHRRWWVAEASVEAVRTEGQKLSLCMIDRRLVPVAGPSPQ